MDDENRPLILLTGGTGYVGGRLIPLLEKQAVRLRCLARSPEKMRSRVQPGTEIVRGDVLDPASLDRALQKVRTAYYRVHLMEGAEDFEQQDRQAATNFAQAAKKVGVRRIIYLGGLGDDADPELSPHFEGLKNPTVVRDKTALTVFPIRPITVKEAIALAMGSTTE